MTMIPVPCSAATLTQRPVLGPEASGPASLSSIMIHHDATLMKSLVQQPSSEPAVPWATKVFARKGWELAAMPEPVHVITGMILNTAVSFLRDVIRAINSMQLN